MSGTWKSRNRVVIGTDGSRQAQAAIQWGAAWAQQRKLPVTLLSGFPPLMTFGEPMFLLTPDVTDTLQEARDKEMNAAKEALQIQFPDLEIEAAAVMNSNGSDILVEASRDAALVVLGTRGRGRLSSVLMGSVANAVVQHAHGPVVLVPYPDTPVTGDIVVGVDPEVADDAPLRFAFEAAQRASSRLVAVAVWEPDVQKATSPDATDYVASPDFLQETQVLLDRRLQPFRAEFPDVTVDTKVVHGDAADTLIDMSKSASLMVVGPRGRGGFEGLLLGSTSRKVAQKADCPVAVIRKPSLDQGDRARLSIEEFTIDNTLVIRTELAGVDPDKDIRLAITEGTLHIDAERRERTELVKNESYRSELTYGWFTRSIVLPADATASGVTATYNDGMLEIRIPLTTQVEPATVQVPVTRI